MDGIPKSEDEAGVSGVPTVQFVLSDRDEALLSVMEARMKREMAVLLREATTAAMELARQQFQYTESRIQETAHRVLEVASQVGATQATQTAAAAQAAITAAQTAQAAAEYTTAQAHATTGAVETAAAVLRHVSVAAGGGPASATPSVMGDTRVPGMSQTPAPQFPSTPVAAAPMPVDAGIGATLQNLIFNAALPTLLPGIPIFDGSDPVS